VAVGGPIEECCGVAMCSSAMCEAVEAVQRRLLRVYLEWCAWEDARR
jgi:hypothetical protein